MGHNRIMFKHSRLDAFFVVILFIQLGLLVLPFFFSFSGMALSLFVLFNIFLAGTNYQCVAHNFIHLPFFRNTLLNRLFSLFNSLGIGVPQSFYRVHHLNHHRYNNDPVGDDSSTFRYGKDGQEENIVKYSVLGILRTDMVALYKKAALHSGWVNLEMVLLLLFYGTLVTMNPRLFCVYVLPSWFGGQIFALWENYCEHHGAKLGDRKRDSVSCYNPVYNFVWFNNGYHQEHHLSPMVHWTKISDIRKDLPEDRAVVEGCHLFNSF